MGIAFRSNVNLAANIRARVAKKREALGQALAVERTRLVSNASAGVGFDGANLSPYSDKYAKKRADSGRSASVDLTLTGQMLRDVQYDVKQDGNGFIGRIFIAAGQSISPFGKQSVSSIDKARWTNELRPWFGLSQQATEQLIKTIRNS
jgi:hypothetical protein